MKIAVYGLGQFGYALLKHLDTTIQNRHSIYGFDTNNAVVARLSTAYEHPYLYPGHTISKKVQITDSPESLLRDAGIVIVAVPSHTTRDVLSIIDKHAKDSVILLNTAKALDYETGKRLSVLYKENLTAIRYKYSLFAGGTIAKDLFQNELLGAVIASEDAETAKYLKKILESEKLRLDISTDLTGIEYASAFKNVISILAGIIHGKGFSYGSETYIISKAAEEMEKLIIHELGGKKETFSIGSQAWGNDMFMSATGKTRNREFGILLGREVAPDAALRQMQDEKKTVEGIKTLQVINLVTDIHKYPLLNYLYTTIILEKDSNLLEIIK